MRRLKKNRLAMPMQERGAPGSSLRYEQSNRWIMIALVVTLNRNSISYSIRFEASHSFALRLITTVQPEN